MPMRLNAYLNFNGKTKEAMEFYRSIFGGHLNMQTYAEAGMPVKENEGSLIIHATLETPEIILMSADGNEEHKVTFGNNVQLCLNGESEDEKRLTEIFNKLSEDGKITMPLQKAFWGDTFGMLTDKFEIHWMINISAKKE